jgi:hypothetical protein
MFQTTSQYIVSYPTIFATLLTPPTFTYVIEQISSLYILDDLSFGDDFHAIFYEIILFLLIFSTK